MEVVAEANIGGEWTVVGRLGQGDPPGSISTMASGRREVVVFGWLDGVAGVWRSEAGADVETPEVRVITTVGFTLLSDLSEPYEADFVSPKASGRVRWRIEG